MLLTANVSPAYIAEIREPGLVFLSDQAFPPLVHEAPPEAAPPINADETVIILYTSGTTGRPKAVRQRLTEFELDNRFILSKWGEEFLKRKLCSTVSQHHIYGLLFSILLPFTAGVPFRRERIQYPESLETLVDDSYMIITVPAFLKRSVEALPGRLPLREPFIFTSGGVLPPEVAQKTDAAFGFWPVEVYGSTETSGIAYRQSKNGLAWTPFDNAEIRLNDTGCLVIRSPYIKDLEGFTTGDLADILEDGRFILKGRADSIVKIEEKRISLPEMESRILQSGLAADVCVVALEDRRQYLAAALALNGAGIATFQGWEKHRINRYFTEYLMQFFENTVLPKKWRYLETLPLDAQGKKKKMDIRALFRGRHGIPAETVLEKTDVSAIIEIFVPPLSDYFDGHFPQFPVMPAVAQLGEVIRLAARYLGRGVNVARIKRIKFSALIRPGTRLRIELQHNAETGMLSFKITGPGGEPAYSSGSVILGDTP
ncbi:AMP-binding protein [Spirochaetia bacterium]|nr:AMP-binding protein [Spirochaetia bacterium]